MSAASLARVEAVRAVRGLDRDAAGLGQDSVEEGMEGGLRLDDEQAYHRRLLAQPPGAKSPPALERTAPGRLTAAGA